MFPVSTVRLIRARKMFPYVAYDLNILSDLPLPELLTGKAGADVDVVIRHAKVNRLP